MPATQPQVGSITLAQYEALPEDKRVEVFDGVIYDMASPSQAHQTISMELSTLINTYIKKKKSSCRVFIGDRFKFCVNVKKWYKICE